MNTRTKLSAADEHDIRLVVDTTIERGSMTEAQVMSLGISRESYLRNSAEIAARIRARNVQFAA